MYNHRMPESRKTENEYMSINNERNIRYAPTANGQRSNYIATNERKSSIPSKEPRARDNHCASVKFECNDNFPKRNIHQEQIRKPNNGRYTAQHKELYDTLADDELYNSCMESEIDSVYSSKTYHDEIESETESLPDVTDDYTRKALQRMETKVNTITNRFVNNVKSQVDETFSKLKIQSKMNGNKGKNSKNEGSGDGVKKSGLTLEDDEMIKRMLKVKMNCYEKIDKSLKILQQVDQLTEKLYKNHMSDRKLV